MSPFVAVEINNNIATVVGVNTNLSGRPEVVSCHELQLASESQTGASEISPNEETANFAESSELETSAAGALRISGVAASYIENLFHEPIDGTCTVIPGRGIIYEHINLPFQDEKQIEQVAPLQLQDLLPFDIADFVLDNIVTLKKDDGSYDVLSSLAPSSYVAQVLAKSESIGANPKFLTTKAAAITGLVQLFSERIFGTFTLIYLTKDHCSLAIFVNDTLKLLREFNVPVDLSEITGYPELLSHIRCSIARVERDSEQHVSRLFGIGEESILQRLATLLKMDYEHLDLAEVVEGENLIEKSLADVAWALGIFAHYNKAPQKRQFVDFRRGRFAYMPAWGHLTGALSKEFVYIAFAALSLVMYLGFQFYVRFSQLDKVESQIKNTLAQVLPTEAVARGQELQTLENKVTEIEEQLRSVGSLSSLSPLESLNELSRAIDKSLDVTVEGMELGELRLGLRGSVADYPSVGKLQTAFEKQVGKFCSVKVDSKGKDPGSPRVKFSAEIILCQ